MDLLSNINKGGEEGGKDHLLMLKSTLQQIYRYSNIIIIFPKSPKRSWDGYYLSWEAACFLRCNCVVQAHGVVDIWVKCSPLFWSSNIWLKNESLSSGMPIKLLKSFICASCFLKTCAWSISTWGMGTCSCKSVGRPVPSALLINLLCSLIIFKSLLTGWSLLIPSQMHNEQRESQDWVEKCMSQDWGGGRRRRSDFKI